jgi:hypothetical protein
MSQENVEVLIDGYPLYIYYINMSFQFFVLPTLCVCYNKHVYNSAFIGLMAKDFLVTTTNTLMNMHHGLCIVYTAFYCHTQNIAMIVAVGEFGSGMYNLYTLAKHFDTNVVEVYWAYVVIMTLTNIYCVVGVNNSKNSIYVKLPLYGLFFMRQHYLCK